MGSDDSSERRRTRLRIVLEVAGEVREMREGLCCLRAAATGSAPDGSEMTDAFERDDLARDLKVSENGETLGRAGWMSMSASEAR